VMGGKSVDFPDAPKSSKIVRYNHGEEKKEIRKKKVLRIRIHGPPGSGFISQRFGSGSGSFCHEAKIERKTLISTALRLSIFEK
jgi:hypothetical protein